MSDRMPVLFIGHGAPTLALDLEKGAEFGGWGERLPKPRAALVISAHYLADGAALELGPLSQQPLIYDFYGFPKELYSVQYAAPGGKLIATEVSEALTSYVSAEGALKATDRGLDHGTWTPLVHLWPKADVPVLQLSLPISASPARWLELGRALSPLRDQGVMVIGSGNITHNLGRVDRSPSAAVPSWAKEFDDWTRVTLDGFRTDELVDYRAKAPALRVNHPTEEHWAPLLVAAGAASGHGTPRVSYPVSGWEFGSLSRRSVEFS